MVNPIFSPTPWWEKKAWVFWSQCWQGVQITLLAQDKACKPITTWSSLKVERLLTALGLYIAMVSRVPSCCRVEPARALLRNWKLWWRMLQLQCLQFPCTLSRRRESFQVPCWLRLDITSVLVILVHKLFTSDYHGDGSCKASVALAWWRPLG